MAGMKMRAAVVPTSIPAHPAGQGLPAGAGRRGKVGSRVASGLVVALLAACASAAEVTEPQAVTARAEAVFRSADWQRMEDLVARHAREVVEPARLRQHCLVALGELPRLMRPGTPLQEKPYPATPEGDVETCLRHALSQVDSSRYTDRAEQRQRRAEAADRWIGIGVEILDHLRPRGPYTVAPIGGSPAERGGLQRGDRIVSINDQATADMDSPTFASRLRGPEASTVRVGVERPGQGEVQTLTLTRARIRVQLVRAAWVGPGLAYLRLSMFREGVRDQALAAMATLLERDPARAGSAPVPQGLVIDLRNCPGGLLDSLPDLASLFLPPGRPVARVVARDPAYQQSLQTRALPDHSRRQVAAALQDLPLAVLVDERTASGAEALAALLRQERQALIVGQTTFGQAEVRSEFSLGALSGMTLTVARLHLPGGMSWQDTGVAPDRVVADGRPPADQAGREPDPERDPMLAAALAGLLAQSRGTTP
ncbi:MAG: hypothetical protein RL722_1262 [Pseudomonadota bacterium]|jgi:carboxyl-terminal processing protease